MAEEKTPALQIIHVTLFISDTALGFIDYKMKHVIDRILPMATMYTRIENGQTLLLDCVRAAPLIITKCIQPPPSTLQLDMPPD